MARFLSVTVLVLRLGAACPAQESERLPHRLLYVGSSSSERAKSFESFLSARFESVRTAERESFDPEDVDEIDVALLDWSQGDIEGRNLSELASPLGPRASWSVPTILLGSAGILIATPWGIRGSFG